MLVANNIWKSFEDLEVLKGIDVEIPKSSIAAIIGKSGTGKSTLLHILGTLDKPDNGEVYINDHLVTNLRKDEIARFRNDHIGFVFQFHHLIKEFTALENVCIPGLIQKRNKNSVTDEATELLEYLGLKDRMSHRLSLMTDENTVTLI